MHLVIVASVTLWAWGFLRSYLSFLPDWFIHLVLVPGIGYGLFFVPISYLLPFAVAGLVYLTQLYQPAVKVTPKPRRSNIPPPP